MRKGVAHWDGDIPIVIVNGVMEDFVLKGCRMYFEFEILFFYLF